MLGAGWLHDVSYVHIQCMYADNTVLDRAFYIECVLSMDFVCDLTWTPKYNSIR
jgi:hypothetical protein